MFTRRFFGRLGCLLFLIFHPTFGRSATIELSNAGFEGGYSPVNSNNGKISGEVAQGWIENSDWADVDVVYSGSAAGAHTGTLAQSIRVQAVRRGAVQMVQYVRIAPGQLYTVRAWMRGDAAAGASLVLLGSDKQYTTWAEGASPLNAEWTLVTAQGYADRAGDAAVMIRIRKPGTVEIDDVSLTAQSATPQSVAGTRPVGSEFFGLHVANWLADGRPKVGSLGGGAPWPTQPFGTLRLWDSFTTWATLEPAKGHWEWAALDAWVEDARARNNPDIVLTLGQSPTWASARPSDTTYYGRGAAAEPAHIQDWRNYVRAVAQRYRGKIKYWEIWNEPNDPTFYTGSIAKLVQLTREASRILRAVDPSNVVISAPAYSVGYLDEFLGSGGAAFVDVIGFHAYSTPPERGAATLAAVRLVLARRNVMLPLWDTEGATGNVRTTVETAPGLLARKYLVDLAFGVDRFNWYTWGPATDFTLGTTSRSRKRAVTPAGQAFGNIQEWLVGATVRQTSVDPTGTWIMQLSLPEGQDGLVLWNPEGPKDFALPANFLRSTRRDLLGGSAMLDATSVSVGQTPTLYVER